MLIVMKFGGTSVGSAERIAQAAQLAVDTAAKGHQVVVVTSAMSKVTDALIAAARRASTGDWDPKLRQELFDRHKAVADALIAGDDSRHAAVLDALRQRLDRFEKLCFGLSMVHELTPRLLDAISGMGEMLAAPLVAAAIAVARPPIAGGRRDGSRRDNGPIRRRRAADGRNTNQDARASRSRPSRMEKFRSSPDSSAPPWTAS